jgi:2-polyprenyl-3-methyl-5-hydroxy-6-metoxy-1,4-benzoquinol methylase
MNSKEVLRSVENSLQSKQEKEYFLIHQARYEYILEQINRITKLQPDQPLRILDVGCFPYHLGAALEGMGHVVYGIASAHEPIHSAKIKVCNIETDKFPFKDNFFDLVIFTEVLEHLPQAPLHALKQMHRVTRKGGHILTTTPNIARSINRMKLLAGQSITYPLSQVLANDGKGSIIYHRHNREYTLVELEALMRAASWNIKESSYFISYTPNRRRTKPDSLGLKIIKWANYAIMKSIPSLQDTLLVVGTKR